MIYLLRQQETIPPPFSGNWIQVPQRWKSHQRRDLSCLRSPCVCCRLWRLTERETEMRKRKWQKWEREIQWGSEWERERDINTNMRKTVNARRMARKMYFFPLSACLMQISPAISKLHLSGLLRLYPDLHNPSPTSICGLTEKRRTYVCVSVKWAAPLQAVTCDLDLYCSVWPCGVL